VEGKRPGKPAYLAVWKGREYACFLKQKPDHLIEGGRGRHAWTDGKRGGAKKPSSVEEGERTSGLLCGKEPRSQGKNVSFPCGKGGAESSTALGVVQPKGVAFPENQYLMRKSSEGKKNPPHDSHRNLAWLREKENGMGGLLNFGGEKRSSKERARLILKGRQ